jgi:hypothetical protein
MATKKPSQTEDKKPESQASTAVVVADLDFSADAGAGMEGATSETFAIPFLSVLQKSSPQVDEDSGAKIEGAKAGMLFNSVSGKMWDGKSGIIIVPCAYRRVFLRWGPRSGEGAGFKGEIAPEVVAAMRDKNEIVEMDGRLYAPLSDGTVSDKRCDRFSDARNHYVLIVDEATGFCTQALLSLTSTQIKKSRLLMSMLAEVKMRRADGTMYTPPTFANMVRITTVPESNDKGTWHGVKFEMAGQVKTADVVGFARTFWQSVSKGKVATNYEAAPDAAPADHDSTAF